MATQSAFWISFDLKPSSDLAGFYNWLDAMQAVECGKDCAFFTMEDPSDDPIKAVKEEILAHVSLRKKDRIYLVYKDNVSGKLKGKFIFGSRKWARWTGWASICEK
ncbi:MAG: hypothetical protein LBT73_02450 [Tannerellaceae bacterium]|jgi:hypothetical protein|nr:hypothetical protein [Tannerellaceae bacterium]